MKTILTFNMSDPEDRELYEEYYFNAIKNKLKLEEIMNHLRQGYKYDAPLKDVVKLICEELEVYTDWLDEHETK